MDNNVTRDSCKDMMHSLSLRLHVLVKTLFVQPQGMRKKVRLISWWVCFCFFSWIIKIMKLRKYL